MCSSSDSGTMLTSANQYLRPEYLPPVSSPLDANKSPLALLAKTCSSIGVDTPSVKSLTSSSNSSSSTTSSSSSANSSASNERRPTPKCKSSTGDHDGGASNSSKLNFKPYELSSRNAKGSDGSDKGGNGGGRQNRGSPSSNNNNNNNNHCSPDLKNHHSSGASASTTTTSSSSSSAPLSYTSLGLPDMHKDSLAAFYKAYGSFLNPGGCCPTTLAAAAAGHGHSPYGHSLMPPPITLDKTGAYPSIYPPTHSATAAAALVAYNYSNYARVKSAGGGAHGSHLTAANPLCRDPYCGGACSQYGSHPHHPHHASAAMHSSHAAAAALMAASQAAQATGSGGGAHHQQVQQQSGAPPCTPATCPNGCNQCEQQRYLTAAAMAAAYGPGAFAGLSAYPQMSANAYANSLATAAALHHRAATAAAAANGAGGTLCNWVVGDTHCGKRFATPEELLQHLKSHTSSAAAAAAAAAAHQNGLEQAHPSPPTSGPPQGHSSSSPPTSANSSSVQQHHHGNGSTPSPHRAHSNSSSSGGPAISPSLSSLHSAASNRYHPYSKASSVAQQQQQQQQQQPPPPNSSLPPSSALSQSASPYSMAQAAAAAAAAAAAGYPFGLSPHGASMASPFPAANLYYPYMAPGLFSGRIGPPVPP